MSREYQGRYVSGRGDEKWFSLIDRSFSMLRPTPELPYLQMLYNPTDGTFKEGFIWGNGWWIQNSYGFALGAVPFLNEKWSRVLQNSLDLFWDRMGDGKRIGSDDGRPRPQHRVFNLAAPDGALGDCVFPGEGIIYKQGDGDFDLYDWFYEATAAGLLMQSELLLFGRDRAKIAEYLPKMRRSMEHIEKTRAGNGLFLVGPSANLLAPSYGGSWDPVKKAIGKGYLTGLAVTYGAALRNMAGLAELAGDAALSALCRQRFDKTSAALPLLLTPEGYFAKSMDPDGTLHGVYGAAKYGYLEGVCNVDAVALDMVPRRIAEMIYDKLSSVEGIRPAGVLCTNYPHLDDTCKSYLDATSAPNSLGWLSGDWVDGGCRATVEGRAILAYLRLNKFGDAYRAADYYMKWAEDYRQDAPLSQWGRNTHNPWANEKPGKAYESCSRPVGVMIDNFAPVTCLLRGLLSYRADAHGLSVEPHIPLEISEYVQREPVYYSGHRLFISVANGDKQPVLYINGKAAGGLFISAEFLSESARGGKPVRVHIDMAGRGDAAREPEPVKTDIALESAVPLLPEDLRKLCENLPAADDSYVREALQAAAARRMIPMTTENFRPMTGEKQSKILELYDTAARNLCAGALNGKSK